MQKFFVVEIENVLPPMASSTWYEDCTGAKHECEHRYLYLRSDVKYERKALDNALDFNLSEEYVDGYRMRVVVVSAKVRKLFMHHKVYAGFFPVAIID